MSITGPGSISAANTTAQTNMMNQLNTLSLELGSGQAAQTYSGLSSQAGLSLQLSAEVATIEGYTSTTSTIGTTLSVAQSALTQIGAVGADVQQSISEQGAFKLDNTGQTNTQAGAESQLDQVLALLNTQVGTNYIFSGSATNQPSTATTSQILNGNGSQAGFTQVISERQQADLGSDGLGRLVLPAPTGASVSVSEDAIGSPFGLKLSGVTSSLDGGATVTGPSGPPSNPNSISINLGSNPDAGGTVQVGLTLPDGTTQNITLTATTASPPGANQFSIGATADDTAANLQAALTSAVTTIGQTTLPAASTLAAANNFFSSDPPQRIDGPPFDTATALQDGTKANTVFWYTGENGSTPALQTAVAQVGPAMNISYGMRANEQAFSTMVGNIAALAASTYSASDPNAATSYTALCQRVTTNLTGQSGVQSVNDVAADIASAQTTVNGATTLNTQTKTTLQGMLQGIDGINQTEIGEQLLTLQNSLSASLSVSARLAQLSLVNFLAPSG